MSDLEALALRVEQASGPDRELDARIAIARDYPEYHFPVAVLNRRPVSHVEAYSRLTHDGFGGGEVAPAYTASLDAAITLVPEGVHFSAGINMNGASVASCGDFCTKAATPALALTSAALRALATKADAS